MNIIKDNIWKFWKGSNLIVIPTNGFVKNNGECVMGAGLALQAKQKLSKLPVQLGLHIKENGNIVKWWDKYNLITFPVKHNWWENADLNLIEQSAIGLANIFHEGYQLGADLPKIYIPKVGCGCGQLDWKIVRTYISPHLSHLVTIVDYV